LLQATPKMGAVGWIIAVIVLIVVVAAIVYFFLQQRRQVTELQTEVGRFNSRCTLQEEQLFTLEKRSSKRQKKLRLVGGSGWI
jgi:hypothetical protein